MLSRRQFLSAGAGFTLAVPGCLGVGNEPEFASRATATTTEPIFENDQLRRADRPFHAEVYDTPTAVRDGLNWETVPQPYHEQFREFDYRESFVAVFASTRMVTPSGTGKGWCPRSSVDGDQISFTLAFDRYPEGVDDPKENYVILERWAHDGASSPTSATVTVEFPDWRDDDVRTCSD